MDNNLNQRGTLYPKYERWANFENGEAYPDKIMIRKKYHDWEDLMGFPNENGLPRNLYLKIKMQLVLRVISIEGEC